MWTKAKVLKRARDAGRYIKPSRAQSIARALNQARTDVSDVVTAGGLMVDAAIYRGRSRRRRNRRG